MPLEDTIVVNISLADPPLGLDDFSTPLIATELTSPQATAFGVDVIRELTPSTWRAAMTEVGVSTSEDPYIAFNTLFGQTDIRPARALWGKRATAVAQVNTYTVPASPSAVDYIITLDGTSVTVDGTALTQTQLRDALIAAIDAAFTGLFDAAIGSASTLTVTALQPGRPFTSSVAGTDLTQAVTTPNVGLDTDIPLFEAADPRWYLLLENSRSDAAAHAAAGAIQSMIKLFGFQTDDADAQGTASLIDIGSELNARGLTRAFGVWHSNDDEWVDAALAGRVGPLPWGSATWVSKALALATGIVPTNSSRLRSKRYTWLERYVAQGVSESQGGRLVNGTPIDLRIGADALRNLIMIRLAELRRRYPKIPYTNDGAEAVGAVTRGAMLEAAGEPHTFIDPTSIAIEVPRVEDQTSTSKGNRDFPGVVVNCIATGAIESIGVSVNIAA